MCNSQLCPLRHSTEKFAKSIELCDAWTALQGHACHDTVHWWFQIHFCQAGLYIVPLDTRIHDLLSPPRTLVYSYNESVLLRPRWFNLYLNGHLLRIPCYCCESQWLMRSIRTGFCGAWTAWSTQKTMNTQQCDNRNLCRFLQTSRAWAPGRRETVAQMHPIL